MDKNLRGLLGAVCFAPMLLAATPIPFAKIEAEIAKNDEVDGNDFRLKSMSLCGNYESAFLWEGGGNLNPGTDMYRYCLYDAMANSLLSVCFNDWFETGSVEHGFDKFKGISPLEKSLRKQFDAGETWGSILYYTLINQRKVEGGKPLFRFDLVRTTFQGQPWTYYDQVDIGMKQRIPALMAVVKSRVHDDPRANAFVAVYLREWFQKEKLAEAGKRAYLPGGSLSYGEKAVALGAPPLWVKCIYGRCVTQWRQYAKTPADKERVAKLTEKCLAIMKKAKLRIPKRSPYAQKDPSP